MSPLVSRLGNLSFLDRFQRPSGKDKAQSDAAQNAPILQLPADILRFIAVFLPTKNQAAFRLSCRTVRNVLHDPYLRSLSYKERTLTAESYGLEWHERVDALIKPRFMLSGAKVVSVLLPSQEAKNWTITDSNERQITLQNSVTSAFVGVDCENQSVKALNEVSVTRALPKVEKISVQKVAENQLDVFFQGVRAGQVAFQGAYSTYFDNETLYVSDDTKISEYKVSAEAVSHLQDRNLGRFTLLGKANDEILGFVTKQSHVLEGGKPVLKSSQVIHQLNSAGKSTYQLYGTRAEAAKVIGPALVVTRGCSLSIIDTRDKSTLFKVSFTSVITDYRVNNRQLAVILDDATLHYYRL